MSTNVLEARALALVDEQLLQATRPLVMCSFGKDSIVLLHLVLRFRKVPVWFITHGKFQEKYAHAYEVAKRWDLDLVSQPPSGAFEYQHGTMFDVFESYAVGLNDRIVMAMGIRERQDGEDRYFCAVHDLLLRPKGLVDYPWDVTFIGHKACDEMHFASRANEMQPVYQGEKTRSVFPLHDWTDADVWAYIKKYDLPYDRARYEEGKEETNPDKLPTCYRCLDTHHFLEYVWCPKINERILSVATSPQTMALRRAHMHQTIKYCTPVIKPMEEDVASVKGT